MLGGAATLTAVFVAGCSRETGPVPTSSPTSEPDDDAQVRAAIAAEEAAIIGLYDAVIAAHPGLAGDLGPVRDEHAAHLDTMTSPPPSAPPAPAVGSRPQAISALIEAEQQAVAQRTSACESATGAEIARLAALIAASEAGHAEFLRRLT